MPPAIGFSTFPSNSSGSGHPEHGKELGGSGKDPRWCQCMSCDNKRMDFSLDQLLDRQICSPPQPGSCDGKQEHDPGKCFSWQAEGNDECHCTDLGEGRLADKLGGWCQCMTCNNYRLDIGMEGPIIPDFGDTFRYICREPQPGTCDGTQNAPTWDCFSWQAGTHSECRCEGLGKGKVLRKARISPTDLYGDGLIGSHCECQTCNGYTWNLDEREKQWKLNEEAAKNNQVIVYSSQEEQVAASRRSEKAFCSRPVQGVCDSTQPSGVKGHCLSWQATLIHECECLGTGKGKLVSASGSNPFDPTMPLEQQSQWAQRFYRELIKAEKCGNKNVGPFAVGGASALVENDLQFSHEDPGVFSSCGANIFGQNGNCFHDANYLAETGKWDTDCLIGARCANNDPTRGNCPSGMHCAGNHAAKTLVGTGVCFYETDASAIGSYVAKIGVIATAIVAVAAAGFVVAPAAGAVGGSVGAVIGTKTAATGLVTTSVGGAAAGGILGKVPKRSSASGRAYSAWGRASSASGRASSISGQHAKFVAEYGDKFGAKGSRNYDAALRQFVTGIPVTGSGKDWGR